MAAIKRSFNVSNDRGEKDAVIPVIIGGIYRICKAGGVKAETEILFGRFDLKLKLESNDKEKLEGVVEQISKIHAIKLEEVGFNLPKK